MSDKETQRNVNSNDAKPADYKLLADPLIRKGEERLIRYNGETYNTENHGQGVVIIRDPRPRMNRLWSRRERCDLPVPRYKVDEWYIGAVPPREITFSKLNDNITKQFMEKMCSKFGKLERVRVYYHPKTQKHMGLSKVVFTSMKSAAECVKKLHNTSIMGNIIHVQIDSKGELLNKLFQRIARGDMVAETVPNVIRQNQDGISNKFKDKPHRRPSKDGTRRHSQDDPRKSRKSVDENERNTNTPRRHHRRDSIKELDELNDSRAKEKFHDDTLESTDTDTARKTTLSSDRDDTQSDLEHQPVDLDSRISSLLQGDLLASREPDRGHDAIPDRLSAEPRENGPAPAPVPVQHHNNREPRDIDQRTLPHANSAPDLPDDRYVPNDRLRFERDNSREHSPRYRPPRPEMGPDDMKMHGYRYDREREPPPGRRYYGRPPGYDRGYYREDCDAREKEYRRRGYSPPRGHYRPGPHSRYRHPPSPERFDHGRYSPPPRGRPDRFRGSRSPEGWRRSSPGYRPDADREPRRRGRSPSPPVRARVDVEPPRENSRRPSGDASKMSLDQRLKEMTGEAAPGRQKRKKKDLTKEQHLDNASSVDMEISEGESDAGDKPQGNGYDNRIADQDVIAGNTREGWNITGPPWNGQGVPTVEGHMWSMSQHEGFDRNPQIPGHYPNYPNEAWPGHFHPPVVPPGMMPPYNFAPPDSYRMMNNAANRHDPRMWDKDENLCQCILSAIVEDLKSTVSRDLNRKVVETMAFKVYESWWDENANARAPPKPISVSAPPEKTVAVEKPDPTPNGQHESAVKPDAKLKNQSLLNAFDPLNWAKNSFEMDGFRIGLGLRSAVSKMPSFRVKKRPRSPSPMKDEDGVDAVAGKKMKTASGKENRERIRTPSRKKHHRIAILDSEGEDDRSDGEDSYAESDHEGRVKSGVLNVDEVFSDSSESSAVSSSDEKSSDEESTDSESDEEEDGDNEEEVVPPRPVVEEIKIKEPADPVSKPSETRRESEVSETADEPKAEPKAVSGFISESRTSTESDTLSNVDDSNISSLLSPTAHGVAPGAITPQQLRHVHPKKRHRLISHDQYEPFAKVPATDRDKLKDDLSHITEKERTVLEALTDLHKTPERRITTDSDMSVTSLHDKTAAPPTKQDNEIVPVPVSPQNELEAVQALLSFKEGVAKQPLPQKRPAVRLKYRDPVTLAESALVADLAEEHSYFARSHAGTVLPSWDPALARILEEHNYSRAIREETASDTERPTSPLSVSTLSAESVYNFKEDIPETITAAERVKLRREQPEKTRKSPKKSVKKAQAEVRFAPRTKVEDLIVAYEMWCSGLDLEDMKHLRKVYEDHLEDPTAPTWVNDSHWVPHPVTAAAAPKKSRSRRGRRKDDIAEPHKTGSARTEGYYKLEQGIKLTQRREMYGQKDGQSSKSLQMAKSVTGNGPEPGAGCSADKSLGTRETRHFMRRIAAEVGADMGDLFKYNQLMFRKKAVKFKRSSIHGWGLFAEEAIGADEMVIEYVGQVVRTLIAERREVNYTELGIGSSYLFRIDTEHIIDATKCGNYARFMNHSCNPSCYAKVITVDTAKKIVIYSKGPIAKSQEITYDYKFPLEDDKVMCYCGAENCRRTLN